MSSFLGRTLAFLSPSKAKASQNKSVRTPRSSPRWETLPEPLSSSVSDSASIASNCTLDDFEEPMVSTVSRAKGSSFLNQSRTPLESLEDSLPIVNTPISIAHSRSMPNSLVRRTYANEGTPRSHICDESLCQKRANDIKSLGSKQVKFGTTVAVEIPRRSRQDTYPSTPSAKALGKRKECLPEQVTASNSSAPVVDGCDATISKKKRKHDQSDIRAREPEPEPEQRGERQKKDTQLNNSSPSRVRNIPSAGPSKKALGKRKQASEETIAPNSGNCNVEDRDLAVSETRTRESELEPKPKRRRVRQRKDIQGTKATPSSSVLAQNAAPIIPPQKPVEKLKQAPEQTTASRAPAREEQSTVVSKKKRKHSELETETRGPEPASEPVLRHKKKRRQEAPAGMPSSSSSKTVETIEPPVEMRKKDKKKKHKKKKDKKKQVIEISSDSEADAVHCASSPKNVVGDQWPLSEDTVVPDEDSRWTHGSGKDLKLSAKDIADIIQGIIRESDDRKTMYRAALHTKRNPWKIPRKTKRQLNSIAHEIVLDLRWPSFYKDRELHVFRFFEYIRGKPEKVGLDDSWTTDVEKFGALRGHLLTSLSTARSLIINKIVVSINKKMTLRELAQSLGKEDPTSADLEMLAMLRQILSESGREGFFSAVDDTLKKFLSLPFIEVKEKFTGFREWDEETFPDLDDGAWSPSVELSSSEEWSPTDESESELSD